MSTPVFLGFPGGSGIHLQCRRPGFSPCVGKIPWRRAWQPTPVFLPGESSGTEDSPDKNPGVGCHFLLQGIFATQGLNPGLLRCRQILYGLSHNLTCKNRSCAMTFLDLMDLPQEFLEFSCSLRSRLFYLQVTILK